MSYTPGKFVWWELNTRTVAEHVAFYTELIGWGKSEWPMPDGAMYTMFGMDPNKSSVAGLAQMNEMVPDEVPSHWIPYVSVEDVDATAEAIKAHGGQIVAGPLDIPDTLRMGVGLDPHGAPIAIMKSADGDPEDAPSEHGQWHWAELDSPNIDESLAFYKAVFGWGIEEMPTPEGKYYLGSTGDKHRCGMMQRPSGDIPAMWSCYLHVDDIDATHAKAVTGGSCEVLAPTTMPGVGRFGQFVDPNGAHFALITPQRD